VAIDDDIATSSQVAVDEDIATGSQVDQIGVLPGSRGDQCCGLGRSARSHASGLDLINKYRASGVVCDSCIHYLGRSIISSAHYYSNRSIEDWFRF
jgi:hypothetical protein